MEQVIRLIPGVLGVSVREADGQVTDIHVLASEDRHAMQLVRDIESTLAAHLRVSVDRRVISVAQVRDAEAEPERLILDSVQLKLRGDVTDVQVDLLFAGKRYVGSGTGPSTRTQRARTVAAATLQAVEQSLGETVRLFLEDIAFVPLGDAEAVVATVGLENGKGDETLVGCAYVWRDDAEAGARAALSAVNRRHAWFRETSLHIG